MTRQRWHLARDFPTVDMGPWPEGFAARREEIYDDTGRLAGGREDDPDDGPALATRGRRGHAGRSESGTWRRT